MKNPKSPRNGFIQIVLLAIVAIALLAYFKIDLRRLADISIVRQIINIFVVAWGTYIKPLFVYLGTSIWGVIHK